MPSQWSTDPSFTSFFACSQPVSALSLVWMAGKVSSEHQADLDSSSSLCCSSWAKSDRGRYSRAPQHSQHSAGNLVQLKLTIVQQCHFHAYRCVKKKKKKELAGAILTFRPIFTVGKIHPSAAGQHKSYALLRALFLMLSVGFKWSEVSHWFSAQGWYGQMLITWCAFLKKSAASLGAGSVRPKSCI